MFRSRLLMLLGAVVGLAFLTNSAGAAILTLDDFDEDSLVVGVAPDLAPPSGGGIFAPDPMSLGGTEPVYPLTLPGAHRDLYSLMTAGPTTGFSAITSTRTFPTAINGVYSHSQDAFVKGLTAVQWDDDATVLTGADADLPAAGLFAPKLSTGAAPLDLTFGGAFDRFAYNITADLAGGRVIFDAIDVTLAEARVIHLLPAGLSYHEFKYSDFVGVDFTKIVAMQMIIDGTAVADLDVTVDAVPEPGTLAMLFGVGVAGSLLVFRRRK